MVDLRDQPRIDHQAHAPAVQRLAGLFPESLQIRAELALLLAQLQILLAQLGAGIADDLASKAVHDDLLMLQARERNLRGADHRRNIQCARHDSQVAVDRSAL